MKRVALPVLVLSCLFSSMVSADVKLPAIISDNMALQRGMNAPIWGWAEPGEKVTVTLNGASKSAEAGADGKWMVKLDPLTAGGPFEMTVAGKNTLTVKNIVVGEVWVCSGQSNMEFGMSGTKNFAEEKAAAKYPLIRHFLVKKDYKETPQPDCKGSWVECSPETISGCELMASNNTRGALP